MVKVVASTEVIVYPAQVPVVYHFPVEMRHPSTVPPVLSLSRTQAMPERM